jgi:hypothetical protein
MIIFMGKWEGKIKGYSQSGRYVGTYQATIEKQNNFLYKMTLSFDDDIYTKSNRETRHYLKEEMVYSSSLRVLKRRFRDAILLKIKSKVIWKEKLTG